MKLTIFATALAGSILTAGAAPPLAPLPKIGEKAAGPAVPAAPAVSTIAPPEVVAAASEAVASLGNEVVLGDIRLRWSG